MRLAQSEAEVEKFKEGIVRVLSNLTIYEVKRQYEENPELFTSNKTIYDPDDDEEAEITQTDSAAASQSYEKEEMTGTENESDLEEAKRKSKEDFPFF